MEQDQHCYLKNTPNHGNLYEEGKTTMTQGKLELIKISPHGKTKGQYEELASYIKEQLPGHTT